MLRNACPTSTTDQFAICKVTHRDAPLAPLYVMIKNKLSCQTNIAVTYFPYKMGGLINQ